MLSGFLPSEDEDREQLARKLLAGRYSEIRMLYYLGKDVFRWIGQCMEIVDRNQDLMEADMRRQSFAGLLGCPPPNVREKLLNWGVNDYPAVFARAVGINSVFAEPPSLVWLTEDFVRNYHRIADALYKGFMDSESHRVPRPGSFQFDLYASGEYAKLLETQWEAAAD